MRTALRQPVIGRHPTGSAIVSLEIVGATLLDATGDYSDATSRVGVDGNGWVAKAVMPWRVGATFLPPLISIGTLDPGYTTAGAATTVPRTMRGGRILRRQLAAQASPQSANDVLMFTVWFSLIGDLAEFATIYAGTRLLSASAATGFYGPSRAGAIANLTNSSTRAYDKPTFAWLDRQHKVVGSGGLYVEGAAMHKHAMNAQQVACIEYYAKDSQGSPNVTASQIISSPSISTTCYRGFPPECWPVTIPMTNLTHGDLCFAFAKVYPWLGDSTAILDIAVDGLNLTGVCNTFNPQTSYRFLNDKNGTYTGHASVKAGAGAGTVQSTELASRATPYATVALADAALKVYHNASATPTHNDRGGGHIWLMDDGAGGAVAHDPGNISSTAGNALCEIRASPANTAAVSLNIATANRTVSNLLSFHVDITHNQFLFDSGQNNASILNYLCDGTCTRTGGSNGLTFRVQIGVLNLIHPSGEFFGGVGGSGTVRAESILLLGYISSGNVQKTIQCRAIFGCDILRGSYADVSLTTFPLDDSQDGKIAYNNRFYTVQNASQLGGNTAYGPRGIHIGNSVIERAPGSVTPAVQLSADSVSLALDNALLTSCTIVGDRLNIAYADVTGAAGVLKRATTRFNLLDERNTKSDLFTVNTSVTGRHGNWAYINGVDNWDCILAGSSGGGESFADGAWVGEYSGNALNNVGRANVTFTSDRTVNGTNAGDGDYHLTGASNAAYDVVPAGKQAFKYDLAGVARRNDGTGAAGAYERP